MESPASRGAFFCAPGRAHTLGGESPLDARAERVARSVALAQQRDAFADRQHREIDALVLAHEFIELANRGRMGRLLADDRRAGERERIVDGDQASGPDQLEKLLVVVAVAGLIGIDEREIEAPALA